MDKARIEEIQRVNAEIESFRECYKSVELWGEVDSFVTADKLIAFLIENPHFQEMANKIGNFDK